MMMNSIAALILSVVSSYIIGSIPTSFFIAKTLKGIDIRQAGSGNAGATNVYRVVGKIPGLTTLIIDILKGVMVVTLVSSYFHSFLQEMDYGFYTALLGLVVICGHIWSVFLGFRGGKGVATTIGVLSIIAPGVLLPSLAVWVTVFLLTKYVSLSSLAMGVSFPIAAAVLNKPVYLIIFAITICIINTYKHKDNIKRLIKGEENKTIIGKK